MGRKIKHGDIIKFTDDLKGRSWVILNISRDTMERHFLQGGDHPGLYAFGGMWYGDKKDSHKSYGKMVDPFYEGYPKVYIMGHVSKTPLKKLKRIT